LAIADDHSMVTWDNPPQTGDARRVMVLYEIDGRTRYTVLTLRPATGSSGDADVADEKVPEARP
jgi:hypothetical protein